jgi:hypothetical protein
LLVDEDDNNPNVRSYYATPLATLKVTVTVKDVTAGNPEPNSADLALNEAVIWVTGDNFSASIGPEPAAENALGAWLQAGGCLFITGQDYAFANGQTPNVTNAFMQNYLGVSTIVELSNDGINGGQDTVTGFGTPFGGFGPYLLQWPSGYTGNYTDSFQPIQEAGIAFQGDKGPAAVYYQTSRFKTTYWGFPFEAIPGLSDRTALLKRFLYWCRYWEHFLPVIVR